MRVPAHRGRRTHTHTPYTSPPLRQDTTPTASGTPTTGTSADSADDSSTDVSTSSGTPSDDGTTATTAGADAGQTTGGGALRRGRRRGRHGSLGLSSAAAATTRLRAQLAAERRDRQETAARLTATEAQLSQATRRLAEANTALGAGARAQAEAAAAAEAREEHMRGLAEQTRVRLERLEEEGDRFRQGVSEGVRRRLFVGAEAAAVLRGRRPETLDLVEHVQLEVFERMQAEYKGRDAASLDAAAALRDLRYARGECDRAKASLAEAARELELLKADGEGAARRSSERVAALQAEVDALAAERDADRATTRAAHQARADAEAARRRVAELEADALQGGREAAAAEAALRKARDAAEAEAGRAATQATELKFLQREREGLAERARASEEERALAQERVRTLQETVQANLDRYSTELLAVREKHDEKMEVEVAKLSTTSEKELSRIRDHTRALCDRELAQLRTEKELAAAEASRATRRCEEVERTGREAETELRLQVERMQAELSGCRGDLRGRTAELQTLREAREQAEATIEELTMNGARQTQKLDVLRAEFYELRLQNGRREEELKARVTTLREQLKIYEDLELGCDAAVEGAAASGGGGGERATAELLALVPSSAGRRMHQSLHLAKRALALEAQAQELRAEAKEAGLARDRAAAELARVKGVLGAQGSAQPYQYFVDELERRDVQILALRRGGEGASVELGESEAEVGRLREALEGARGQMEMLKGQRDELSRYLQEHLEADKRVGGGGGGGDGARRRHHRGGGGGGGGGVREQKGGGRGHSAVRTTARGRQAAAAAAAGPTIVLARAAEEEMGGGGGGFVVGGRGAEVEHGTSVLPQPFVISA